MSSGDPQRREDARTDPHPVSEDLTWEIFRDEVGNTVSGSYVKGPPTKGEVRVMPVSEHEEKLRQEREARESVACEYERLGSMATAPAHTAIWNNAADLLRCAVLDSLPATPKEER